jgi:hypothetical protein
MVAAKAHAHLASNQITDQMADGLKLLGAVQAGLNISKSVSARSIRVLQDFLEAKGYEAFGHESLTDFLNNSPHSPMSKSQYYDRLEILDKEGDTTFDLLNNLRIPVAARKLLGNGQVRIEGDLITIGEESFQASDRSRVKQAIQSLAEQVDTSKEIIKKGEKEVQKWKKKADQASQSGASSSSYDHALLNLLGAFAALIMEVEKLSEDQREEKLHVTLPQIANQRLRLEEAFQLSNSNGHGKRSLLIPEAVMDGLAEDL